MGAHEGGVDVGVGGLELLGGVGEVPLLPVKETAQLVHVRKYVPAVVAAGNLHACNTLVLPPRREIERLVWKQEPTGVATGHLHACATLVLPPWMEIDKSNGVRALDMQHEATVQLCFRGFPPPPSCSVAKTQEQQYFQDFVAQWKLGAILPFQL